MQRQDLQNIRNYKLHNKKNEENIMTSKNSKTASDRSLASITNVLLLLVVASIAFLGSESYRSRLEQKAQQEKLYSLMESFYGHVWASDLKEDGRRLAVAKKLQDQIQGDHNGTDSNEALLRHGADGIRAYVDLSDKELLNAVKDYTTSSKAYVTQLMLATYAPIAAGRFVPSLGKEDSQTSERVQKAKREAKAYGAKLAAKTLSPVLDQENIHSLIE